MPDTRGSADECYKVFMSMPESEWRGVLDSILFGGGALEVEENKGFRRAVEDRGILKPQLDYVEE